MVDPEPAASDVNGRPDSLDAEREAALLQDVIRAQERHREGGVEPELAGDDAKHEAGP